MVGAVVDANQMSSVAAPRVVPTRDEWKAIEEKLSLPYFEGVVLLIDGYEISLQVSRLKSLQFTVVVYVNGCWTGRMLTEDCEERRRFMRPRSRSLFTGKKKAEMERAVGKRYFKANFARVLTWWEPNWPSVGALRRHLLANNSSIQIVSGLPSVDIVKRAP